jgi:pyrroline-5-carboxylate reductase
MARTKVIQDEIPGTDTPLSRLCDQFLEERAAVETARATFQATEKMLLEEMQSTGKKSIKHGGVTIRSVHQEEKNKIQVVSQE